MQEHYPTPGNSLQSQSKDTNIQAFLACVRHLQPLSNTVVLLLSERFSVSPEHLVILIEISRKGGGVIWN